MQYHVYLSHFLHGMLLEKDDVVSCLSLFSYIFRTIRNKEAISISKSLKFYSYVRWVKIGVSNVTCFYDRHVILKAHFISKISGKNYV